MAGLQDLLMGGLASGILGGGNGQGGLLGNPLTTGLLPLLMGKGGMNQQQPQQQQEPPAWYNEAPQWMQELPAQQREMYANSFGGMQQGMMNRGMPRRPLPLQQQQPAQQTGMM